MKSVNKIIGNSYIDAFIGLISGLVIGSLIAYICDFQKKKASGITADRKTWMHNIEKVLKDALAEGIYNDIFDYKSEQGRFFNLLTTKKKHYLFSEEKVMVGDDFAKVRLNIDEH